MPAVGHDVDHPPRGTAVGARVYRGAATAHRRVVVACDDSHCAAVPPSSSLTLKTGPLPGAQAVVANVLPVLLHCALGMLGQPDAMEANPDIVQEFFSCMDRIAKDFTSAFYNLPQGGLDALMDLAVRSLSLQERYSLVAASSFVSSLILQSSVLDELVQNKDQLLAAHGRALMRAVLVGFASVAPRSAVPNLIELLATLLGRPGDGAGRTGVWMREILFAEDFVPSKAGPDAKEKLIKAVLGSRSLKKTRDAANQFTLVARGLEGSSFGYASVSM
ncbi:hypothetical protein BD779DRAFT_829130 [Infundibulicybe gibba]|nr:hypothetical protein BD779DRAFT_829130 [Infundibulicybe gibba]